MSSSRFFTGALTIISQDMDGPFYKWLEYSKLEKYDWFFNSLSYKEIEYLNDNNITSFIKKVNQQSINRPDRKKLCGMTRLLRSRPDKIRFLTMVLDGDISSMQLTEYILTVRELLELPIPNKHCVNNVELQNDLVLLMRKCLYQLLRELGATKYLVSASFLGTSINKYLECTLMIIANQLFMKDHIESTVMYAETLKEKVLMMDRDFY